MVRLADGDRDSFAPLFAALWPRVRGFAQRALHQHADAEDVAQQAMIKVFTRASEFDPARQALPWIMGITAWEIRTFRQSTKRRKHEPAATVISSDATPEQAVIDRDLRDAALHVLGELSEDDIATILAKTHDQPRPKVSPATFRKRWQRALGKLRHGWKVRHGAGPRNKAGDRHE